MNYDQAKIKLESARNPKVGKPIANNTRLILQDDDSITVRFHDTDIVRFKPDGAIVLNSGGFKTVTTKERISEFAKRIDQDKGIWYVHHDGKRIPFADGITIHPDGAVTGQGGDPKAELKLRRQVREYAKGFITALMAGDVPAPSSGDCWYCAMREVGSNIPLGEKSGDKDHILSHIEEKYYVPSLLVRAMEVMPTSIAAKQTAMAMMHGQPDKVWSSSFVLNQLVKIVSRYVSRQLGLVS